jgi:N-methylhydantoinase B
VFVFGVDTRPGREGQPFGGVLLFGQGWGGTSVTDGVSFCLSPLFNCRSAVIEYIEKDVPIIVWEWGVVMDSAGAGEYRGGLSSVGSIEAISDVFLTPFMDAARFAPPGAQGGGDGVTSYGMLIDRPAGEGYRSWNGIIPADGFTPLFGIYDDEGRPDPQRGSYGNGTLSPTAKLAAWNLKPHQIYRMQVAAPGGYGNSLDRAPERVRSDVSNERVSLRHARDSYGVVIDAATLAVDDTATLALREELRGRQAGGDWSTPQSYYRDWPVDGEAFKRLADAPVIGAGHRREA